MSKWTVQTDLGKITDMQTFIRFCSQAIQDLQGIINGKIDFSSNITSQIVNVNFPKANTDVLIAHSLNKISVNFIPVNKNISCDVYHGSGADDVSKIYLRCTQAATVSVLLF